MTDPRPVPIVSRAELSHMIRERPAELLLGHAFTPDPLAPERCGHRYPVTWDASARTVCDRYQSQH